MAENAQLGEVVEEWLTKGRGIRLHFVAALESRFEAETRVERSRVMATFHAVGTLVGLLLYPALRDALPDVAGLVRLLYLELSLPIGCCVSVLLWFNPEPFRRELMLLLSLAFNSLCVTYLFAISLASNDTLYVSGIMLLLAFGVLAANLRFAFALVLTLLILIAFHAAIGSMANLTAAIRGHLMLVALTFAGFVLWVNWRHETELRRGYLFALRERLRGQDLSRHNVELDLLARRDALTGLANRRAYDLWMHNAWAEASMAGGTVGLIIIDVDCFKAYNDYYGHAAGDLCLQTIARSLRDQLRGTSDLVARIGGEEFAVLLPALTMDLCSDIAERLRVAVEALELPHLGAGQGSLVTISAGVSSLQGGEMLLSASLFSATDAALYQAKATGRNRVCTAQRNEALEIAGVEALPPSCAAR